MSLVTKYVEQRKTKGAANGTVNRELGLLTRLFRFALENRQVARVPVIRKLKEAPPRQGFFERSRFEGVRRLLPLDLQVAVTLAYTLGWRIQSEVLTLQHHCLDLEAETLRRDYSLAVSSPAT